MIKKIFRKFSSINQNHYDMLKIQRNANMNEVKKAYYGLVKQFHPDTNKDDPNAEENFKKIVKAYETLKDPISRQIYDLGVQNQNFSQNQEEDIYQERNNNKKYYENKWYGYKKPNYQSIYDEYQGIGIKAQNLVINQIAFRIFFVITGIIIFDIIKMISDKRHQELLSTQKEIFQVNKRDISDYIDKRIQNL